MNRLFCRVTALLVLASGLAVIFFAGMSWKLVIPPLALYFLCLAVSLPLFAMAAWFVPALAAAWLIALSSAFALALSIVLAWQGHAPQLLSLRELLMVPLYALWKLPVYLAYFLNRKSAWIRTARKV